MKRLVPLWITALGGFVLIVAYFIPATQGWGETAAIWFDIIAAIAFVLGGGNLLKIHLKKVSDRQRGYGYSVITVVSFLVMLFVGLTKFGSPPASNQEFYGETFADLPLASLPGSVEFRIAGIIPDRPDGERLHASVRRQISQDGDDIVFRGWMRSDQQTKLLEHRQHLDWQCTVERLYELTQPASPLAGVVTYYADHDALSFKGRMSDEQKAALLAFDGDADWQAAVETLYLRSQQVTSVSAPSPPPFIDVLGTPADVLYDRAGGMLTVIGPMRSAQRDALMDLFPHARPLSQSQRGTLLAALGAVGDIQPAQMVAFEKVIEGTWKADQLVTALNEAGKPQTEDRSACEMYADQQAGVTNIPLKTTEIDSFSLNAAQVAQINAFAADEMMTVRALADAIEKAGKLKQNQKDTLDGFMGSVPTIGERNKTLAIAMMKVRDESGRRLTLNQAQLDLLLPPYRAQAEWRRTVADLFIAAHVVKYSWSGEYRAQGNAFWWLYEYGFKPLQATIFAMLAFYVASAAFRAFRAKNIEATLLLGTAFIILLGRTFAGVWLTSWMPEALSGLRIENLTVYIMQVFNTAGNRAIMIGIALGIASTSLKVLLGVDRSYLGGGED